MVTMLPSLYPFFSTGIHETTAAVGAQVNPTGHLTTWRRRAVVDMTWVVGTGGEMRRIEYSLSRPCGRAVAE